MKNKILCLIALIPVSSSALYAQTAPASSTPTVQFVTVEKGVKLEVLDWGGAGRPLVFWREWGTPPISSTSSRRNSLRNIMFTASHAGASAPPAIPFHQTETTQPTAWATTFSP